MASLTLAIIAVIYIIFRLILPAKVKIHWRILFIIIIIAGALMFPRYLSIRYSESSWIVPFGIISTISIGFISFLFTYTIIKDIILLLIRLTNKKLFARRNNRIIAITTIISAAITTAIGYYNAQVPKSIEVDITLDNTNSNSDKLKIVQLSDLHFTVLTPKNWLNKIVSAVNYEKPDIIVITGDFGDLRLPDKNNIVTNLNKLSAKYGVYGVLGNHEYYGGQVDDWIKYLKSLNVDLLINENCIINHNGQNILLGGVNDNQAVRFGCAAPNADIAIKSDSTSIFQILLSHQPQNIDMAVKAGFDLQLSGHTHSGQFFPWNIVVKYLQKYFKGLYKVDNTQLYVNQGTGFWAVPLRIGSRSEISILNIEY